MCHPERSAKREVEGPDEALLLAHVLGKDRAWLLAHDVALTDEQKQRYEELLARHAAGEPIAYLIGEAWFYGRRFEVNPSVLIPRTETEHLIDEALMYLRGFVKREIQSPIVLDVGTGSGCIAMTIAAEIPEAIVYATERSRAALEVARKNVCHPERSVRSTRSRGSVTIELADLFPADADLTFDCVIANLPYIPTADLPLKPNPVGFEPREATDGGPDGLHEYRRLLERLPQRMNAGGLMLLEAAPPTIVALHAAVMTAFPGAQATIGRDYAGLERYVKGVLPGRAER